MLFLRIKELSKKFCGSPTELAKQIGLLPPTFLGYLNEKRQDNLWPLLPKILELFPKIDRDWLYFGEGQMLQKKTVLPQIEEVLKEKELLQQKVTEIENKLEEERGINKKLVNRLLLEGSPQVDSEGKQTGEVVK